MQGYILKTSKVKDEDLLVQILSNSGLESFYRFYGLRHSYLTVGYKIDFESQPVVNRDLKRLRHILHLNYDYNHNYEVMQIWQSFLELLYQHLKDNSHLDAFYFELLESCSQDFNQQSTQRTILNAYLKLLKKEGRLSQDLNCIVCEQNIQNQVNLIKGFLPVHPNCSNGFGFHQKSVQYALKQQNTMYFEDEEIERLWQILMWGL